MGIPLAIESNWILDVVFERDTGSLALWAHAQTGTIDVFTPAISITESVKAFESMIKGWRERSNRLAYDRNELVRMQAISSGVADLQSAFAVLNAVGDRAAALFWPRLSAIIARVRVMEVTADLLLRAGGLQQRLKLSPADALTLATVSAGHREGQFSVFVSRDVKAFETAALEAYFRVEQLSYFSSPRAFLASAGLSALPARVRSSALHRRAR